MLRRRQQWADPAWLTISWLIIAGVTASVDAAAQETSVKRSGEEFVVCSLILDEMTRLGVRPSPANPGGSPRQATISTAAAYEAGRYDPPEELKQELGRLYNAKLLEIRAIPEAKRAESLADRYARCEIMLQSAMAFLMPIVEQSIRDAATSSR